MAVECRFLSEWPVHLCWVFHHPQSAPVQGMDAWDTSGLIIAITESVHHGTQFLIKKWIIFVMLYYKHTRTCCSFFGFLINRPLHALHTLTLAGWWTKIKFESILCQGILFETLTPFGSSTTALADTLLISLILWGDWDDWFTVGGWLSCHDILTKVYLVGHDMTLTVQQMVCGLMMYSLYVWVHTGFFLLLVYWDDC